MGKHLYANPKDPTVCVVLWLAVYLATHEIWEINLEDGQEGGQHRNASLFPGDHIGSRMGKRLTKLIESLMQDEEEVDDIVKAQVILLHNILSFMS